LNPFNAPNDRPYAIFIYADATCFGGGFERIRVRLRSVYGAGGRVFASDAGGEGGTVPAGDAIANMAVIEAIFLGQGLGVENLTDF